MTENPDDEFTLNTSFDDLLKKSSLLGIFAQLMKIKNFKEGEIVVGEMSASIENLKTTIKQQISRKIASISPELEENRIEKLTDFIFEMIYKLNAPYFAASGISENHHTSVMLMDFAFFTGYELISPADSAIAAKILFDGLYARGLISDYDGFSRFYAAFNAGNSFRDHLESNSFYGFVENIDLDI